MFSRRKLFCMIGAGSAAAVVTRLSIPQAASGPTQMSMLVAAQQEINRRRSQMINSQLMKFREEVWRDWVEKGIFQPYQESFSERFPHKNWVKT